MFLLEGNIGSGKSTFLKLLKKNFNDIAVVLEPVNNWKNNKHGQSLLKNFYDHPLRWSYTIEYQTLLSRVKEFLKEQNPNNKNKIIERSIYSGYYCFAKNGYDNGFLNEIEWQIYNHWFKYLARKKYILPLGFIYLKVDPLISYKRVKKRNRKSEKNLTLEYLEQINYYHDQFLINKFDLIESLKKVPVLIIDCNEEFENDKNQQKIHFDKVKKFITNLT